VMLKVAFSDTFPVPLNDTRTRSRSKELIEALRKVIRVVGVTVNEAVGSSQADDDHAGTVVHGRDSGVRTNISAEGTGSPGNSDSRGWRRMGSRVGDRDAQAYRMPGNGEAPIFWSRLQTPDSEKKRPARCAESPNCLSRQTLRFNKQSIYEGKRDFPRLAWSSRRSRTGRIVHDPETLDCRVCQPEQVTIPRTVIAG
jgi:hypothetical protein